MAQSQNGSNTNDAEGNSLMLADSRTAVKTFLMDGSQFNAVPKSKFLFYVEFNRPVTSGSTDPTNGLGLLVKNVDRPRVAFTTETLNQYNRKIVVQTGHQFEDFTIKFHDTVDPKLMRLFTNYYEYYYGDHSIYSSGASNAVYDIVSPTQYQNGKWGFHPQGNPNNSYFFTDITVYQFYNGLYDCFSLINPKITSFNPDDYDYSVGQTPNEIVMTVSFEGIVYEPAGTLTTAMAQKFGLDSGNYYNVSDTAASTSSPALTQNTNSTNPNINTTQSAQAALWNNITPAATTSDLNSFTGSVSGIYDSNSGLALGTTAGGSIQDLVSGNYSNTDVSINNGLSNITTGITSQATSQINLANLNVFSDPSSLF